MLIEYLSDHLVPAMCLDLAAAIGGRPLPSGSSSNRGLTRDRLWREPSTASRADIGNGQMAMNF